MPTRHAPRLSRREREIMNAVFVLQNRALAEEIRERLANAPSLSAIRVMLVRLEKKGLLRHAQDGGRNVYSATTPPVVAKRAALRDFLHTFFGGSMRDMVVALVNDESWTAEDLDSLKAQINRVRKHRRS